MTLNSMVKDIMDSRVVSVSAKPWESKKRVNTTYSTDQRMKTYEPIICSNYQHSTIMRPRTTLE